jgi:hypothetical protein
MHGYYGTQAMKPGFGEMASRFFSKSPEAIPLPFNSRKIIPLLF